MVRMVSMVLTIFDHTIFIVGSKSNQRLPLFDLSRPPNINTVYINCDFADLQYIIDSIWSIPVIFVIIAPDWHSHCWYWQLQTRATHRLILPLGGFEIAEGDSNLSGTISAFFLDCRYTQRAGDLVTFPLPLSPTHAVPRQSLSPQSGAFLATRPTPHINVGWFLQWGKSLPKLLFSDLLFGIQKGFPTRYLGGGQIFRDYSSELKGEDEKKAIEKAQEAVGKGWAAGPFKLPPFPNDFCGDQAIVTKNFTIPKHKWINDGSLRLIFHKSFPLGGVNGLTPHRDAAFYYPEGQYKYLSLSRVLSMIVKAGRGCELTQWDARDAYKQIQVFPPNLNQQVFKAGEFITLILRPPLARSTATMHTASLHMLTVRVCL